MNIVTQAEALLQSKLVAAGVGLKAPTLDIGVRSLSGIIPPIPSIGIGVGLPALPLPSPSALVAGIAGQAQGAVRALTAPLQNIAGQAQAALSGALGGLRGAQVPFVGSDVLGNVFAQDSVPSNISLLADDDVTTVVTVRPLRMLVSGVDSIGEIQADVVLREHHVDTLVMTSHPVETGSQITDHSYLPPAEIALDLGWSNSSEAAAGDANYAYNQYQRLIALQHSRTPFEVFTGKRYYPAMLLVDLSTETTQETEYALIATLHCRELIAAQVSATTLPPIAQQAIPAKTNPQVNTGTQTAAPANPSPGGVSGSVINALKNKFSALGDFATGGGF